METQTHIDNLADTLGAHLRVLSAASQDLKTVLNDCRQNLWWTVPSFELESASDRVETLTPSNAAWSSVENQLTDIWMDNRYTNEHGILVCGIEEVLNQLAAFDQAKLNVIKSSKELKLALTGIRGNELRESSPANKDISTEDFARARDEYLAKGRDLVFHQLLRRKGFNEINFRKANRRIWITPTDVLAFNYVWSKAHYRKRALTGSVFKALKAHYDNIDMKPAVEALSDSLVSQSIRDDTQLFRLAFTKPVMRANVKYDTQDGSQWTNRHAPGITVIPQTDPPRIQWRPTPSPEEIEAAKQRWLDKHNSIVVRMTDRITVYRERSEN